ncbi:17100_t:CDS:2 [Cetraspora pellucida]|uniref:17100_t:CDS:1 n=1 Tax=Cetraspora pellucida TaxID=1433469 RepID=A0A9N9G3G3_9GLOM|nr:17100_t:CDS:2 [Cetraspora pellucida]
MSDVEPLTPIEGVHPRISLTQSSLPRDSVITYSSDVLSSSAAETETRTNTFSSKPKSESSPRFYRQKRFWTICVAVTIVLLAIFIPLFILVIFPAIAQSAIDSSSLSLNHINLTDIKEGSVTIASSGSISNAGPFSSTISFDGPVSMVYNDQEMGQVNFDTISTNGGSAEIILDARELTITNKDVFGNFSLDSFTQDNIKMTLRGSARVKSVGITRGGLNLNKEVTLKGANDFPSVNIISLNIEQDPQNPQLVKLEHVAQLYNPSIFYINMGQYGAEVTYNNSPIANMVVANFILEPGMNNISMTGYAIKPNSVQDLGNLGRVMQAYVANSPITTQAKGTFAYPDNVNSVSWLTSVVTSLTLNAVIGNSTTGPQVITGLDLGQPSVNFDGQSSYAPLFSANNVTATYKLPFNINSRILQVSQDITLLTQDNQPFANLTTSFSNVTFDNGTAIMNNISPNPLYVVSDNYNQYQEFLSTLTKSDQGTLNIMGHANIVASTVLGDIPINGIPFNLSTSLQGFSNFSKVAPTINHVTIIDATSNYMLLGIDATLYNPSSMSISLGNTSFKVVYDNTEIGLAYANMSLGPGPNNVSLQSTVDPNSSPQAFQLVSNFMNNISSNVTVLGYDGSSGFESLKLAFEGLTMNTSLPPLKTPLVKKSTLHIQDTTTSDHIATGIVDMANPFDAGFNIQSLESTITADDLQLATVSQSKLDINIPGNKTITTNLPISLTLDPVVLFGLLRQEAKTKNMNTEAIDALISIGNIQVPGVPQIDISKINPRIFDNFDVVQFSKSAMSNMNTTMNISATVEIIGKSGSYQLNSPLPMTQIVTSNTDDSLEIMIKFLSIPIATQLVAASNTDFTSIQIQDPSETEFTAIMSGSIVASLALNARIATPNGLSIVFNDKTIGDVNLPPISIDRGTAKLDNVKSKFTINDKDALADFTRQFLQVDTITWTITSPNITVTAFKLELTGVQFNQKIQLNGANGFKNAVKINNFQLPGDAPEGGISTTIDSTISNSGTIGMKLGTVSFDVFSGETKIGEVSADGFVLKPKGVSTLKLNGRLIPQSGVGLQVIEKMFNDFLAEKEIPVSTKGTGINPPISWVDSAFKSLLIDTVVPVQKIPPLLPGINLNEMSLTFTPDTAYDPDSSSKKITADVRMPFGFTLTIKQVSQEVDIVNDGVHIAKLTLPETPTFSKIENHKGTVVISYEHIPLKVFDDAHDNFDSFVKDLTIKDSVKFGFNGATDAFISTPVGDITINNIPVNVISTLPGFQGFNTKSIPVNSIDVTNSTSDSLTIPITTAIFNPTNNTISVGDVNFDFLFENQILGTALISGLTIIPGDNPISSIVTFKPTTKAAKIAGLKMFSNFISNVSQTTVISGSEKSTTVESLKDAFSAISMSKVLPPLSKPLMGPLFLHIENTTLTNKVASGSFLMNNQFTSDISMTTIINGTVTFHGLNLGLINVNSPIPITFKGKSVTKSPEIPTVLNLDPKTLVTIIKLAAKDAGIDISPMKVDLSVQEADTSIGDFAAPLTITQKNVDVSFDESALLLMGVVAGPVAQKIIDNSEITMHSSFVTAEQPAKFNTHTVGEISNIGKLRSIINYPSGLTLTYNKQKLGVLDFPPLTTDGEHTSLIMTTDTAFKINDIPGFVKFSGDLLSSKKLTFTISADDLEVVSLDFNNQTVTNLTMSKDLTINGFDGLQDVKIDGPPDMSNPDAIVIKAKMNNPSDVGVDMGTVKFSLTAITSNLNEKTGFIGPLVVNNLTMLPNSTTEVTFILSPTNFDNLLELATCGGQALIKGVSVVPSTKVDVPWLTIPIQNYKTLQPFPPLIQSANDALMKNLPAGIDLSKHTCFNNTSTPTTNPKETPTTNPKETPTTNPKETPTITQKEGPKGTNAPKVSPKPKEAPKETKVPKELPPTIPTKES